MEQDCEETLSSEEEETSLRSETLSPHIGTLVHVLVQRAKGGSHFYPHVVANFYNL